MFRNIDELLSRDFKLKLENMVGNQSGDRILKSSRIEQAIYDELHADSEELAECEEQGRHQLKTFDSLVNDVFQSIYGIKPRYLPDEEISSTAQKLNKPILSDIMEDESYGAIKSVCEGKELPAIGATVEFTESLLPRLGSLLEAATGGKGKINALETLEKAQTELAEELLSLMHERKSASPDQTGALDSKAIKLANRLESKTGQAETFGKIISENMRQQQSALKNIVSSAMQKAADKAQEVESALAAWGNGQSDMQRTPLNMEVLKRVAKSDKLKYIARFLGRFKKMLSAKRTRGYTYGCGEIYDITFGRNLSGALTSELSNLAGPELMPMFLKKYQNGRIKSYRKREAEKKGAGDVIVCLDESSSTFGENNAWGMAIAMLLLEICRINKRNFALIHFSSDIKTDLFIYGDAITSEAIMAAAETFLRGGTNFEKPIREAMRLCNEGVLQKPDIVFLTDGICNISDELIAEFADFKARTKSTLTGILLDKGQNISFTLEMFSDVLYRTSELCGDDIARSLISGRI